MFDDPKGALRRMEEELRAAEADPEPEEVLDQDLAGFFGHPTDDDSWLEETKALLGEEPAPAPKSRRKTVPSERTDLRQAVFAGEGGEPSAVYVEKKNRKLWKQQKKERLGCLPLLLLLEVTGILALIWWWIRWLR